LFAIENLIRKTHKEINNENIKKILDISIPLLQFDPNFTYEDKKET